MNTDINDFVTFENLGTINKNTVSIGNLRLWFSYKTIVAFSGKNGFYCRVNVWGKTTGKLLNEIEPDHNKRIEQEEFNKKLSECFMLHGLLNPELIKAL